MSELSEWLSREVDDRRLSLRELADQITRLRGGEPDRGVKHTTIKSWADGYAVPTWHNAGALADSLGVPRQYVRAMAGYVDPEDDTPSEDDVNQYELLAIYQALNESDRRVLLRSARALRDSPSRRE